ncbi:MAG TPA: peptidylprolyl isomerase [Steroidobacteraceae bacterium]|jgi:peptidyl-prolyl cis-trans isomerase SurA|nr:peptidylprolyl isomerase [Steroidobacteraceae bacterium]
MTTRRLPTRWLATLGLAFATTVFAAPPTAPSSPRVHPSRGTTLDRVVAVVNDGVVLESELDSEVQAVSLRLRAQNVALPAEQVVREQVLERLVLETIQDQHAEHAGITVSDEQVNSALQDIARRNNVSFEQLPNKLAAEGLVYADYRSNLRREIQRQLLRARDVVQRISITPRELEQYIERQKGTASANNEYNISHILVAIAQDANPGQLTAARSKAEDLVTRARNGEAFNQLAVSYSDSQTALDGGTLGWLKGPALPTFLADIVPRMKPGQISDVIQTGSGFHLVRLNDMRMVTNTQIVKQTHLRHILLKTTEIQDDATVRQKLSEMRAQILAGADFAVLAKASSVDPGSAIEGGDLGWTTLESFAPEFVRQADQLKDNEISEPFQTQFGWHIVQMLGRRDFDNTATAEREQAFEQLRASRVDEATDIWLQQLRDEAYVELKL